MAKFLVVEAGDHTPYALYEAESQRPEDFQVEGKTFIHCLLTPGTNPSYFNVVNDGGVWKATPKIDTEYVKNILKLRQEFGFGLIAQFAAENRLLGITDSQSAAVFSKVYMIILAFQVGALDTAIYMFKQMTSEDMDGTFLTASRALKYVNLCEEFIGVPKSQGWI